MKYTNDYRRWYEMLVDFPWVLTRALRIVCVRVCVSQDFTAIYFQSITHNFPCTEIKITII